MTGRSVTDEQYGKVALRVHELQKRLAKGAVEFQPVMDGLQLLIEGKSVIQMPKLEINLAELLAEQKRFYQEVFGITADFSDLAIPEKKEGFPWLLVMLKGLTANKLFDKCKERFGAWRDTEDLDVVESARKAEETYAIWLRDRVEADEENKNKSAKDCEKEGINGITLEDRLLLELWYFWNTGKHLDISNWTLCSGSRDPNGNVPHVHWFVDELSVYYYDPDDSHENLRSRSAVS